MIEKGWVEKTRKGGKTFYSIKSNKLTKKEEREMLNLSKTIEEDEIENLEKCPLPSGHTIAKPKPLFKKLKIEEIIER